jgi:hypothetical protein
MKGPHFFEKRKKEMARQEKAKQKAERKAQRKAGKGKDEPGEPGDDDDDLLLDEEGGAHPEGQLAGSEEVPVSTGKDAQIEHASTPSRPEDPS